MENLYPTFLNPPIIEALADIRVTLPSDTEFANFESLHEKIKDRFPSKKNKNQFQAGFQILPQGPKFEINPPKVVGCLFESKKDKKIVQARFDGFTFNKLKPYETWDKMRDEAHELWDTYFAIAKPRKITRLQLRYINRIVIPLDSDMEKYFLTIPKIAPGIGEAVSSFLMRLVFPDEKSKASGNVILTMENPTEETWPVIFDIDVIKNTDYEGNPSAIWEDFESLRLFKNKVFFESLTPLAKELFK